MAYKYSNQDYNKEHMARAVGRALPASTKASIEICNTLRRKSIARAKTILKEVIDLKKPIEFTRFTNGAGHKKGMASGKYPQKAANEILKLIETLEANAQFKGLNTSNLMIMQIMAHNAGNVWRYGRHRRRKMKRTTIEIIVKEGKTEKKEEPKQVEKIKNKPEEKKLPKEGFKEQSSLNRLEKQSFSKSLEKSQISQKDNTKKSDITPESKPKAKEETKKEKTPETKKSTNNQKPVPENKLKGAEDKK